MARNFTGAQWLQYTGGGITSPLTLAAWIRPNVITFSWFLGLGQFGGSPGSGDNHHTLSLQNAGQVRIFSRAGSGTGAGATSATVLTIGAWIHVAGIVASTTDRRIYVSGMLDGSNTTLTTPLTPNSAGIGARHGDNVAGDPQFNGRIAGVGIWNVALAPDEISALSRGVSPRQIRKASLWGFWPLLGIDSPEPDMSGNGRAMTLQGAPTRADHAPMASWR